MDATAGKTDDASKKAECPRRRGQGAARRRQARRVGGQGRRSCQGDQPHPQEEVGRWPPRGPSRPPGSSSCPPRLSVLKISANMSFDDRPDRYPFREIEAKWQRVWEDTKQFKVTEEPGRPEVLLPRDVPVSLGPDPHGPRAGLRHRRPARPLQVDARASTCCTRWAGTPSACPPRTPPSTTACTPRCGPTRTSTNMRDAAPAHGHLLRLGPRGRHLRSRVLPLGAAHLHPHVRARARLQEALDGELVPVLPDGPRQRAGRGGPLLALRLRGGHQGDRAAGSSRSPTTPRSCSSGATGCPAGPSAS